MPRPSVSESYDEVPYEGGVVAGTHPEHLATIAKLFGVKTAPVEACSVLEIGCAAAANLLPMAYGLPNSTFVGIDPSHRQIEMGNAVLAEYGVKNVELLPCDVRETLEWDRKFDYIVCHGVFSWVAADVRDAIFEACRRLLTPNGVAYISYNTLPGFHARAAIGEMMRFHGLPFAESQERASQARALLQFLADATGKFENTDKGFAGYHAALADELELLEGTSDSYILHEHFSEHNEAFYFHEFIEMAGDHGLQYLGDAAFHTMMLNDLPTEVADGINAVASNQVALEQYRDFVVNRMFRKTLLCHEEVPIQRQISVPAIASLSYRQRVAKPGPGQQWRIVKTGGLKVEVRDHLVKKVLDLVEQAVPLSLSFEELRAKLSATEGSEVDAERVAAIVLSLYSLDAIDFRTWTPFMFPAVSERPCAFGPAVRSATRTRGNVPLPLHGVVQLDPFVEAVLPFVDGTRTVPQLVETVLSGIAGGSFKVKGVEPEDLPERADVERLVPEALEQLRESGLLVS